MQMVPVRGVGRPLRPLLLLLGLLLYLLLPPQLRPLLRELDIVDHNVYLRDPEAC
jgi:hypothetical protein